MNAEFHPIASTLVGVDDPLRNHLQPTLNKEESKRPLFLRFFENSFNKIWNGR